MMITTTQAPQAAQSLDFSDVEATGLLTLFARAIESASPEPILGDEQAERIAAQIDDLISDSREPLLRLLHERKVDPRLVVHIALRAQKYDQYAIQHLHDHPGSVIANLGCGMDTRFQRIDDGSLLLFDIDLPTVIGLRRRFLQESDRYRMIPASVFDHSWMDAVAAVSKSRVLFMAEGLFMYLDPQQVRQLVQNLQSRFPESVLVCEVVNKRWASGIFKKVTALKMQRQLKLGKGSEYNFGLAYPDEMESWGPGIEYIDRWSYFESSHPKLGWMRIFRNSPLMSGVQYTVRYRLH